MKKLHPICLLPPRKYCYGNAESVSSSRAANYAHNKLKMLNRSRDICELATAAALQTAKGAAPIAGSAMVGVLLIKMELTNSYKCKTCEQQKIPCLW